LVEIRERVEEITLRRPVTPAPIAAPAKLPLFIHISDDELLSDQALRQGFFVKENQDQNMSSKARPKACHPERPSPAAGLFCGRKPRSKHVIQSPPQSLSS